MTTITAQWAKCATCGISYLQEDKDAKDCQSCLREKAALFDVLAARVEVGAWTIPDGVSDVTIAIRRTGERVHGATLAEAVTKAMEAEGAEAGSRLRTDPADWKAGR